MSISTTASESIMLADAPAIPGLSFRHFRGPSDYVHMAAIIDSSKLPDDMDRADTPEELAKTYEHLPNCDPYQDMLFVEVDGRPIGYTRIAWYQEENGPRIYWHIGFLHADWRRRGIGRAMFSWNEQRLREIAATHTTDCPKMLQVYGTGAMTALQAIATSAGYQPVRYGFDMVRPNLDNIPDFPLPDGLEVRPVTPDHLRTIWEADQEAFRDHWGYSEPTEEDYASWLNFPYTDHSLWKIAWDGDQVAGQVKSFISPKENQEYNRKRGYTEFISTRRPWRKRGLARALIVLSLHELKARGMTEAALGVDAENPNGAVRVYEACGFEVVKRSTTYRKPIE